MDRDWRTELRDAATLWLFSHGELGVAHALWRSQIAGLRRLDTEHLGIKILVGDANDITVLASATRSWTDSVMPGPLDLAFEHWLPAGDWPVFAFAEDPSPVMSG